MDEFIKLTTIDPRWQSLIEQDARATIFHHPAWMKLLSESYGYKPFIFGIADPGGELCAGIPIAEVSNFPMPRRWVALPFSDYCAPLYRSEESLQALTRALAAQQKANHIRKLEIRSALPGDGNLETISPYVLHTVPLDADPAVTAKRVSRQQMQNVRTAEKNEIRVVRGNGLDELREFYRLHSLTRRKHGVPVQPWSFFVQFSKLLLEQNLGFVLLAYQGDACISAGVFLHWQKTLTYKYSATDEATQNLRPNHLVTWTAMKWGCENGFTTFDFGRADLADEGLRSYKTRWGAEETPLSYSYLPKAPVKADAGDGKLSEMVKNVIRRSPVWVCQALGTVLYRYVG